MFNHPLARDVAIAVAVKTTLVIVAAVAVFGPRQRPAMTAEIVAARIATASPTPPSPSLR